MSKKYTYTKEELEKEMDKTYINGQKHGYQDGINDVVNLLLDASSQKFISRKDEEAKLIRNLAEKIGELLWV